MESRDFFAHIELEDVEELAFQFHQKLLALIGEWFDENTAGEEQPDGLSNGVELVVFTGSYENPTMGYNHDGTEGSIVELSREGAEFRPHLNEEDQEPQLIAYDKFDTYHLRWILHRLRRVSDETYTETFDPHQV